MNTLIIAIHVLACIALVVLILLQSGKEGMGVIFGGGSTSVFGSGGAGGLLRKLTISVASIFVITSLSFTFISAHRPAEESIILDVPAEMLQAPPAPRGIEQELTGDGAAPEPQDPAGTAQ